MSQDYSEKIDQINVLRPKIVALEQEITELIDYISSIQSSERDLINALSRKHDVEPQTVQQEIINFITN